MGVSIFAQEEGGAVDWRKKRNERGVLGMFVFGEMSVLGGDGCKIVYPASGVECSTKLLVLHVSSSTQHVSLCEPLYHCTSRFG